MAKPRGRPFQTGNTAGRGRPPGSRNRTTLAAQGLLGEHAEAITRKCLLLAMQGDRAALRMCMDRVAPTRKAMPVRFTLPPIRSIAEVSVAVNAVAQAVAKGQLTPGEGQQIVTLVDRLREIIVSQEFGSRLQALEEQLERR